MKQHSSQFLNLVAETKKHIKEVSPKTLKEWLDQHESFYLIDVREEDEWVLGHIPTAIHLSKGIIERDIEKQVLDQQAQIVVYCSGGFRSALVADNLQAMGYNHVYSLATGSRGWLDAGYGLESKI